jgi:hypothetical protein
MRHQKRAQLLAYVTSSVNEELPLQNEYLAPENLILRAKLPSRLRLSDPERATLAGIGKRLGRKALGVVASVAKPDTMKNPGILGKIEASTTRRPVTPWTRKFESRTPASASGPILYMHEG